MKTAGLQATLFGAGSAIAAAVLAAVTSACPGLLENWPQILLAAVVGAVGKFMHSNRAPA